MKRALILGFLLAYSSFTANAYVPQKQRNTSQSTLAETIKFGPQFGINFLSKKVGGYFEYKFAPGFGIQSGIYYFNSPYILIGINNTTNSAVVKPKYIALPIIARGYSGAGRQFSLFAGIHTGYLIGGEQTTVKGEIELTEMEKAQENPVKVSQLKEADEANNFDFSFVGGFDYEADFGLIWGITYTKGLVDIVKSENSYGNWSLQLVFGFNFGKFLS